MNSNTYQPMRLAYILMTSVMFLPILLWPIPLLISDNPVLADALAPIWFLNVALLLLVAVSMDSILYGITNLKQAMYATLWIAFVSAITIFAVQNQYSPILALLYFIHATRSGFRLFGGNAQGLWLLWLAWGRDTSTTLIILFWGSLWLR